MKAILHVQTDDEDHQHLISMPEGVIIIELDFEVAKYIQTGDIIHHPVIGDEVKINYRWWNLEKDELIFDSTY